MSYHFVVVIEEHSVKYNPEKAEVFNKYMRQNLLEEFSNMQIIKNEKDKYTLEAIDGVYDKQVTTAYDDLDFAVMLSMVIESGKVMLKFVGEDYEIWGYLVEKNGVRDVVFSPTAPDIIYRSVKISDFTKEIDEMEVKKTESISCLLCKTYEEMVKQNPDSRNLVEEYDLHKFMSHDKTSVIKE